MDYDSVNFLQSCSLQENITPGKQQYSLSKQRRKSSHWNTPTAPLTNHKQNLSSTAKQSKNIPSSNPSKNTPRTIRYLNRKSAKAIATVNDDNCSDSSSDSPSDEPSNEPHIIQPSYSAYFQDLHSSNNLKTSDHTLSKLPILDPNEYLQALKSISSIHRPLILSLQSKLFLQFPQWYFELSQNFNLLFFGYGSKIKLLDEFCKHAFSGFPLLTISGYFPNLYLKTILTTILELINHTGPCGSISDQISLIIEYFSNNPKKIPCLYLLIHNIDGPALRNDQFQTALSLFAQTPNIHLIASVDHINAPYLWDNVKNSRFNWIWHDVTTFEPLTAETTFENSILLKSTALGPHGVMYVLKSLNANARGIFKILAQHQLDTGTDEGMSHSILYQKSNERMFVTNEMMFNALLLEFKDHKVMIVKKNVDGEVLSIPLGLESIQNLLEEL